MNEETDPELLERTVTCHTDGCVNEGIPVTFTCLPLVICGGCGNQITDITPAEGAPHG